MSMKSPSRVASFARKFAVSSALVASLGVSLGVAANPQSLHDLLPTEIKNTNVLNVVTDAKWPPFTFVAEDGKTLQGFEVDLLNAIGAKLGVDIKQTSIEFSGMIPGVQANRYDIAMMAVSDTPERRKTLSFVDYAYLTQGAFVLVDSQDTPVELSSLCDKTVGLQSGTNFVDFIEKDFSKYCTSLGKPVPKKLEFASADAVYLSLYSGRADFIVAATSIAGDVSAKAPRPVQVVTGDVFPKDLIGIAYLKDRTQLGEAILAGLKAIQADGTYDQILKKWNVETMALPAPGINLGALQEQ